MKFKFENHLERWRIDINLGLVQIYEEALFWSRLMAGSYFQNPENEHVEGVSPLSWLWCLLFGTFYFALHGVWRHAAISLALAIITAGISWVIYPFFAYKAMRNHYLRIGWKEVFPQET
jgi:hypothetical protein